MALGYPLLMGMSNKRFVGTISGGADISCLLYTSAGRDSMTLAHLLLRLQKDLDFNLAIANFNHHLRPEADEEGEFVAEFARINGCLLYTSFELISIRAAGSNLF